MGITLKKIANPLVEASAKYEYPVVTTEEYLSRISRLWEAVGEKYTHIVVYGDREHFSNLEYLCGFDPRFEEALLVLTRDERTIIVGYEGLSYAEGISIPVRKLLFTPFGLVGQVPGRIRFQDLLAKAGVVPGARIGLIGWKYFKADDFETPGRQFEVPWYIVQNLTAIVGIDNMENAAGLLMDNESGLRHSLEAKELVLHEIAGTLASRAVHRVLRTLREGIGELTASEALALNGYPLTAFPNVNFGFDRVSLGIASPQPQRTLSPGDAFGVGMGYRRSMCHRAGLFATYADPSSRDAFESFFKPYFASIVAWYEALGVGVSGGEVYAAAKEPLGSYEAFGVGLNPGHLSHTDEWSNSPFNENSGEKLHSGSALQCDYTALDASRGLGAHVEDGLVIANAALREEIRAIAPSSFERMVERREYMRNVLGINIADEILPTSDMPGVLTPFMMEPDVALANG